MAAVADPIAGVIRKLRGTAAVTALVGTRIGVFGSHSSEGALPFITVEEVTGADTRHLLGDSTLASATVQINCIGSNSKSATDVRLACLAAWRAVVTESITVDGGTFEVRGVAIDNLNERRPRASAGRDTPRFIRSFDLGLSYRTS